MNIKYKHLLLSAAVAAMYGCGNSSSSSDNAGSGSGTAPTFNASIFETDGEIGNYTEAFDPSTGLSIMQLQYTFNESDTFNGANETFDIDLLKGFTDPEGDSLRVANLQFVWDGPDCSDTIVAAVNYAEFCQPFLTEAGFEIGESITFLEREDVRRIQGVPRTNEVLYGFDLKQTVLSVTPSEFAPVLFQDQVSVVNISYDVTDGTNSVKHYLLAKVVGENSAPRFVQLDAQGNPLIISGEEQIIEPSSLSVSEKDSRVSVNLLAGIYDADVQYNRTFARTVGDLDSYYQHKDTNQYRAERIGVNINLSNGFTCTGDADCTGLPNFASTERVEDPITGDLTAFNLSIDPSVFADILVKGEELTITYTFNVTDGNANNMVERTATFLVLGANEFNEPQFTVPLAKTILASDDIVTFDLFEGILDLDGDDLSIESVTIPDESDVFGISVNQVTGEVRVDPYAFLYLENGNEETFTLSYAVSDGLLVSETRDFNLTVKASEANLITDGTFESGSLDNGWLSATPEGISVSDVGAYTGDFGTSFAIDNAVLRLGLNGIDQGKIEENDRFYVSWQSENTGTFPPFTNVTATIKAPQSSGNGNLLTPFFSTMRGVSSQVLHTVDFVADDDFTADTNIELTFQSRLGITVDDVRLVTYDYVPARNLINGDNNNFNNGTAPDWDISVDSASISVTEEANRFPTDGQTLYGLSVATNADWAALQLKPEGIRQGTFKSGIRYVVELDFRNTGGPENMILTLVDEDSGNTIRSPKNRISTQATLWQSLKFHFVTDTDSEFFSGAIASDPDFDWSTAENVRLEFTVPPNVSYDIDNIRMYPVPD